MATIIASKCKLCGFSNIFSFGGGMFNYQTNCPVPAINKETLEFENVNYLEHKDSEKYLFYSDDVLKGDNGDLKKIINFNLELNLINNYCPKCREKAWMFQEIGCLD